jgi:hypothetical protein
MTVCHRRCKVKVLLNEDDIETFVLQLTDGPADLLDDHRSQGFSWTDWRLSTIGRSPWILFMWSPHRQPLPWRFRAGGGAVPQHHNQTSTHAPWAPKWLKN